MALYRRRAADLSEWLRTFQGAGAPVQTTARAILTGVELFWIDVEFRALYASRGKKPVAFIGAGGRPGYGADLVRLVGPDLAGHDPEGLKVLSAAAQGKTPLPRRGRRLELGGRLVAYAVGYAMAGWRPRHRELHREMVKEFPGLSQLALRKLWSRVTRWMRPSRAGRSRARPRLAEEDFEWSRLPGGGWIGLHRPSGIEEAGGSRAAVMTAVARRLALTEKGGGRGGKCH